MKYLAIFFLAVLFITSCIKPPDYPDEPVIEFVSLSHDTLNQNVDTTLITFSFTDGDGDLGVTDSDSATNIIVTDTRTGFMTFFKMPFIPQQGVGNGISGEVSIVLLADCCFNSTPCLPNTDEPWDIVVYDLQIQDRSGNLSNVIQTSPINLRCN